MKTRTPWWLDQNIFVLSLYRGLSDYNCRLLRMGSGTFRSLWKKRKTGLWSKREILYCCKSPQVRCYKVVIPFVIKSLSLFFVLLFVFNNSRRISFVDEILSSRYHNTILSLFKTIIYNREFRYYFWYSLL